MQCVVMIGRVLGGFGVGRDNECILFFLDLMYADGNAYRKSLSHTSVD